MSRRDLILSFFIFGALFIIQEAFINQVHLPFTGFNLILISALTWSSLSSPESAAVTGFVSGAYLDLSPATDAPFGLWTLIMVIAAYSVAYFGASDETAKANPVGLIGLVSVAVVATEMLYLFVGVLFGLSFGSFFQIIRTLIGFGIWSAIIVPIITPFVTRLRSLLYTSSL